MRKKYLKTLFLSVEIMFLSLFIIKSSAKEQMINFQLKSLDNDIVLVDSLIKEKPVLIVFWALWCKYCKIEIRNLEKIADTGKLDNISIILLNIDKTKSIARVRNYIKSHKIPFDCYIDPTQKLLQLFSQKAIPFTVYINRKREIEFKHIGYITGDDKNIIKKILKLSDRSDPVPDH